MVNLLDLRQLKNITIFEDFNRVFTLFVHMFSILVCAILLELKIKEL